MINPRIIDWNKCEEEFIRYVDEDSQRITSIIQKARQRLEIIDSITFSEETISFIVENYYEVIKELLLAYLLKARMRSRNHQCLISYFLQKNPNHETEATIIAQMSYYRNRLIITEKVSL